MNYSMTFLLDDLLTYVDICLHMHEQRRPNCRTCSAAVYRFSSCTKSAVPLKMWILSRSTIRGLLSSVQFLQSSQAVRKLSSSSHQPSSLSSPSPAITWKKQAQEESAEQSMIPDKRSCLQRVSIHPAEEAQKLPPRMLLTTSC